MSGQPKEPSSNKATAPAAVEPHKHKFLEHFKKTGKKLGFWGGVLLVLHILFHVIEILILPAILMWLGVKK